MIYGAQALMQKKRDEEQEKKEYDSLVREDVKENMKEIKDKSEEDRRRAKDLDSRSV